MASTSNSLPPLTEAQLAEALALRTAQRAKRASEKEKLAEEHKEKGNAKFKAQDYEGAVACYEEAMKVNGPRTAVLSNMALAYLKAEEYEAAEGAAQRALLHDPTFTKARYRRALARKGQDNILGAMLDIEVVLKQEPNLTEAKAVLRELNRRMDAPDYELDDVSSEDEYPDLDEPKVEIESASDSSDWNHEGNGIPCRYYNHNGCNKERDCMYSHAPDHKSVRDRLGQNVCIYFLTGNCRFGADKCSYSHRRAFLPETGWWTDPEKTAAVRGVLTMRGVRDDADYMRHFVGMLDDRLVWFKPAGADPAARFSGAPESREAMGRELRLMEHAQRGGAAVGRGGGRGRGRSRGRGRGNRGGQARGGQQRGGRGGEGSRGGNTHAGSSHTSRWLPDVDGDECNSDDEIEQRMQNCGFTNDEFDELISYGVKPWDDDAWDVLEAMRY